MKVLFVLLGAIGLVSLNSAAVILPEGSENPPKAVSFPVGPIGDLEQQTKQNPTDAKAWYQPQAWSFLGHEKFLMGIWQEANDDLAQAVDHLGVTAPDVVACYGEAAAHLQHFDQADKLIAQAQASDSNNASVWEGAGTVRLLEQRFPESMDAFQRAVQLDPKNWRAWDGVAVNNFQLQKYTDAIAACRKASALFADDRLCWRCAYQCYRALGRTDDAVRAMDQLQLLTSGKSAPPGAVPILPPL